LILASILGIIGRIGAQYANTFMMRCCYVARPDDQDCIGVVTPWVTAAALLAVNIVMIQLLPGTWGPRLSFLSVAIWWAVFTIPLLRSVPEPGCGREESAEQIAESSACVRRFAHRLPQCSNLRRS
jgi:UMF1 family MFS transporter